MPDLEWPLTTQSRAPDESGALRMQPVTAEPGYGQAPRLKTLAFPATHGTPRALLSTGWRRGLRTIRNAAPGRLAACACATGRTSGLCAPVCRFRRLNLIRVEKWCVPLNTGPQNASTIDSPKNHHVSVRTANGARSPPVLPNNLKNICLCDPRCANAETDKGRKLKFTLVM